MYEVNSTDNAHYSMQVLTLQVANKLFLDITTHFTGEDIRIVQSVCAAMPACTYHTATYSVAEAGPVCGKGHLC